MTETVFVNKPRGLEDFDDLVELALDLRWSWNHDADDIWRPLDPELWDLTRNPWVILQTIAPDKLEQLAKDADFRARVNTLVKELHDSRSGPAWFQKAH